jgi:hypothetical protein
MYQLCFLGKLKQLKITKILGPKFCWLRRIHEYLRPFMHIIESMYDTLG